MMIGHPVPGCSSVSNLPCHQVGISLMLHPSFPFHGPYCRLVSCSDIKTRTDPIDHPSCITHCSSIFDLSFHVLSSGHICPAEASHMSPTTIVSGDFIIGLSTYLNDTGGKDPVMSGRIIGPHLHPWCQLAPL